MNNERDFGFKALLPFVAFVVFYLGFSIFTRDFSRAPMSIAFVISSAIALSLNHKKQLNEKIEIFATGMGQRDIMIMCLIFILAGIFTSTARAIGAVDAAVSIAQNIIPPRFIISGLFLISALISLAVGTSCGTIAAIAPIAASLSGTLGLEPGIALGATVGGAMFGDNMSLISDTTIASARTQNIEMRDKMIYNLKIIIIPAVLSILLYSMPTFSPAEKVAFYHISHTFEWTFLVKISPYILLLILGILGVNVMFLLLSGTILCTIMGLYFGSFDILEAFTFMGSGAASMADTLIVAILAGGLLQMIRYNGGINYIINKTNHFIKTRKMCEFGICFIVGIVNFFTANNTVAIITVGTIVKELGAKHGVNPKRIASLLDTTSCCIQGIIPYGAQILIAVSLASSLSVSAFDVIKGLFYPPLVGVGICVSLLMSNKNANGIISDQKV